MRLMSHSIQFRERSDRMPALNQRFKSSCDYRVPASGRFARGTVLSGDHAGVLPHSTDFSHSLGSDRVNLGWHSRNVFITNLSPRNPTSSLKRSDNWNGFTRIS